MSLFDVSGATSSLSLLFIATAESAVSSAVGMVRLPIQWLRLQLCCNQAKMLARLGVIYYLSYNTSRVTYHTIPTQLGVIKNSNMLCIDSFMNSKGQNEKPDGGSLMFDASGGSLRF